MHTLVKVCLFCVNHQSGCRPDNWLSGNGKLSDLGVCDPSPCYRQETDEEKSQDWSPGYRDNTEVGDD